MAEVMFFEKKSCSRTTESGTYSSKSSETLS
ncbi:MAG: hypothetical protein BWX50_00429 [Euryarchaeota archaeon ADurb.Bin009]|nr:MAG: hypothetical protein BWX50_00429 [Euryarchaeota archaeon ADurb.Bin009]